MITVISAGDSDIACNEILQFRYKLRDIFLRKITSLNLHISNNINDYKRIYLLYPWLKIYSGNNRLQLKRR